MDSNMDIYKEIGINIDTKQFKKYYNAGLLNEIEKSYINDVKSYWFSKYEKNIDPTLHLAYYNLTGKKDVTVIPRKEMWNEIIPFFNDLNMSEGYSDKNIYDKLITSTSTVENVLKCVFGSYFDEYNNSLSEQEALNALEKHSELIIKPSNTNDGIGIKKLSINNYKLFIDNNEISLKEIVFNYNYDFIVQKIIKQHNIIAAPHPYSVNTLRMVTLRWKGEIIYLLTFARFGANQDVKDNAGGGGLCLGVDEKGNFHSVAIDANCQTYTCHPTTNFQFSELKKIPNFNQYINFVKDLHKDILHHNFVSWDIAIGEDGSPIFIEANYKGATWLYQLCTGQPLLGEYTTEIIEEIKEARKNTNLTKRTRTKVDRLNSQNKKQKRINEKLRLKNKSLQQKLTKLEKELASVKTSQGGLSKKINYHEKQLEKIESSTSWQVTKPIRVLGGLMKRNNSKT